MACTLASAGAPPVGGIGHCVALASAAKRRMIVSERRSSGGEIKGMPALN